jgi:hypothetical protein
LDDPALSSGAGVVGGILPELINMRNPVEDGRMMQGVQAGAAAESSTARFALLSRFVPKIQEDVHGRERVKLERR